MRWTRVENAGRCPIDTRRWRVNVVYETNPGWFVRVLLGIQPHKTIQIIREGKYGIKWFLFPQGQEVTDPDLVVEANRLVRKAQESEDVFKPF